jgi:hypothetical protein
MNEFELLHCNENQIGLLYLLILVHLYGEGVGW